MPNVEELNALAVARGFVTVAVQMIAHNAAELLIVLHNKYSQHIRLLLFLHYSTKTT